MQLSNQPSDTVRVAVSAATTGDTDLTIQDNLSLTFGSATWNTPQTVTVRAAADGDDVAGTRQITHSAIGAEFNNLQATLTATESDDDKRGFIVHPAPGAVTIPEGGTHQYTVKLGTQPTAAVTVNIAASGDSDVTVAPASLTFNPTGNNLWNTAQTVTISAAEDNSDYADDKATIAHTVGTTDPIYMEQTIGNISVTVSDTRRRPCPGRHRRPDPRKRHGNLHRQTDQPAHRRRGGDHRRRRGRRQHHRQQPVQQSN